MTPGAVQGAWLSGRLVHSRLWFSPLSGDSTESRASHGSEDHECGSKEWDCLIQLRGLNMLPNMALERPKRKRPVDGTWAASQGMSAGGNCSPVLRPTGILHQDPS